MKNHSWLNSPEFWINKRVMVTGGAGFLGTYVVQKLRERGAAEIIVPRSSRYDPSAPLRACLRDIRDIRQLLRDTVSKSEIRNLKSQRDFQSEIILIHLAACVGGIPLRFPVPLHSVQGQGLRAARRLRTWRKRWAPG